MLFPFLVEALVAVIAILCFAAMVKAIRKIHRMDQAAKSHGQSPATRHKPAQRPMSRAS
jgi:hypothetical protein